ncbi:hypothetical protein KR044_004817, partial [Drosophila immigrans]
NNTLVATYADDTAVLTKNSSIDLAKIGLQEYLDAFQEWARNWNVCINADKCANMTFANRLRSCPSVTLNGRVLTHSPSHKYLGVILDRRLKFESHIKSLLHSYRTKLNRMSWLLSAKNKLSLDNKVRIYKCILAPSLF